jgi:hypothetical protein
VIGQEETIGWVETGEVEVVEDDEEEGEVGEA